MERILCGVPQGSGSGPIFFNIYLNDLFLFSNEIDICNFAELLHKHERNSELSIH